MIYVIYGPNWLIKVPTGAICVRTREVNRHPGQGPPPLGALSYMEKPTEGENGAVNHLRQNTGDIHVAYTTPTMYHRGT